MWTRDKRRVNGSIKVLLAITGGKFVLEQETL